MKTLKKIIPFIAALLFSSCGSSDVKTTNDLDDFLIIQTKHTRANCMVWDVPNQDEELAVVYCKCEKDGSRVDYIFSLYDGKIFPAFGKSFSLLNYDQAKPFPLWVNNVEAFDYMFNNAKQVPTVKLQENFFNQ